MVFVAPTPPRKGLPKHWDLTDKCPPVYAQGDLQSCTPNAVAAAVEFCSIKERKKRIFVPSRLFLYYNTRKMEGTVRLNTGVSIRDAIKSIAKLGDCPEELWPYIERKFRIRPPQECYNNATRYKAVTYQRIHHKLEDLKGCIASGYPFVFGMLAHQELNGVVWKTGRLGMHSHRGEIIGHHAVLAVGYDEDDRRFKVRNSWGPKFGMNGYFTMPFEYLLNDYLANDFWTIQVVS